jgi:adhesin transport system outer membrane protein
MRHARLQRDAFESIDKAWAARTITIDRVAALTRQIEADRKVIIAYGKEYELGQRSLIDLLNAQNQLFNGLVQLESSRSLLVFADYQLLAAMGQVLSYLKTTRPVDAEPLEVKPVLLFPTKLPPILIDLPKPGGSEPINIGNRVPPTEGSLMAPPPRAITVGQRWPSYTGYTVALDSQTPSRWSLKSAPAAQPASGTPGSALSYAAEIMQMPLWPIKPRAE